MTAPDEDDAAERAAFWRLTQEALVKHPDALDEDPVLEVALRDGLYEEWQERGLALRCVHLDGHEEPDMSERTASITEAKARLSELIASGEEIVVTNRGVPVATLQPVPAPREKRLDLGWLRELTAGMPYQEEDSGTFMRRVRDTDRY